MERDRLDLNALNCLVEIARRGNLTAAGMALGQSPSALSKKISALEQRLGERLFQRTGRGLVPTEFANEILPRAHALLASEDDLLGLARERRDKVSGQVRVGVVTPFAHLTADLYNAIRAAHPQVRLVLSEGLSAALETDLAAGRLDLAVVMVHVEEGGVIPKRHEIIGVSQLYLAARRRSGVVLPETVEFRELDGLPLALPEETGYMRSVNGLSASAEVSLRRVVSPALHRHVVMRFSNSRPATKAVRKVGGVLRRLLEDQLAHDGAQPQGHG
jgi:LysR family nitrogen assimilation transcriptional regulator